MMVNDSAEILDLSKTPEGFIVARARLARTGIQTYLASELQRGGKFLDRKPTDHIRIYRSPEEVFSADSMASYAARPLTIEHQGGFVDADNAKELVAGWVGDSITREGDYVVGRVHVTHRSGIDAINAGKLEVSVGYSLDVDPTPGVTPSGEAYDGSQTNIRANHVSLVARGRCGPACRMQIGDACCAGCAAKNATREGGRMSTRLVDVNGISIEMPEQAAQAFDTLRASHSKDLLAKDEAIASLGEKLKTQDAELAKAEARADAAEAKLKDAEAKLTPQALDASARERAKLIADAAILAPKLDCKALDALSIKREALKAVGVALDGKSDDYIAAAFEARVDNAPNGSATDGAKALAERGTQAHDRDAARESYLKRNSVAYRREKE